MIEIVYHGEAAAAFGPDGQAGGFENADGNGEIHLYPLLDGVSAMCLRLEMGSYTEIRTQIGMLEINFCANGRFETRFSLRDHVLLKPGDMAISCYDGVHGTMSESHFPLGYYEGICLEVAPDPARRWIARNAPALSVDFSALNRNLLGSKWYTYGPAGPRCEHVFRELYESIAYLDPGFLQLKVLELLMLLGRVPRESAAVLLSQAGRAGPASPGSSADRPGGVCLAVAAGGGARDLGVPPAKNFQAGLWRSGVSLYQGVPAGTGRSGAGAQRKAGDTDRAGCGV